DDNSDGQDSGSDSDDDSDGQGSGSDSDGDLDGQGSAQGSSKRNPLTDEEFQSLGEALVDLHDLINKAINKHASENPASYEDVCQYNVTPELNARMLSVPIQNSVNSGARAIKRIIESQMWAKEAVPIMYDESGSDFDCDLLAGVPAGNSRIFYTEDIVETHKSSFVIAIDISGSMGVPVKDRVGDRTGYCRLEVAQKAALSVATALEELDVPVSVLYFNTSTYIGKSFNESMMQSYPRIGAGAADGTETNKAVLAARKEFKKLDMATRKQLLVVTDGCPADVHAVETEVQQCTAEGIDVASINICESRYGGIPNYQVIQDADDLPAVLDDMIQQNLLSSIEIS
ncbi:VWA domain-containing protein, partial [Vibrio crassostreae]|uniref:VWA domain-containing protein n=1 Tax=Vibrio crassostreae TaxID=246167 RepID=UPI001B30AC19